MNGDSREWQSWRRFFEKRSGRELPELPTRDACPELPASLARSLAIFQLGESGGGTIIDQARTSTLPGVDEDYAAVSQQMFTCEYWDYTEEAVARYPEHRPLNLKVRQSSFAWSTEGATEFVGMEYEIQNDGFEVLRDIYIGYFVDSDAGRKEAPGYWADDGGELLEVGAVVAPGVGIGIASAHPVDKAIDLG